MNGEQGLLSVVVPVYNEQDAIVETLEKIRSCLDGTQRKYEVVVVNDGSSDQTGEVLKGVEGIRLVSREVNRGYGYSLKEGMKIASGEWILITDADGSYPIEKIPSLISDASNYDMIIGERRGKNVHIGFFNRAAKLVLKSLIYVLTSNWIKDINSGLRIFRKELAFKYWSLIPDGFSLTTTITVAAMIERCRIKFIPIDYHKRVGKSKIKPFKDFMNFVMLVIKIVSYFKPLRFYIPISLLFLALSVARSVRDILVINAIGSAAVLLFVISIHAFFFGILADLIVTLGKRGSEIKN